MSAQDIYNRHRALYTFKALITKFQTKSVEILDAKLAPSTLKSPFSMGSIIYYTDR